MNHPSTLCPFRADGPARWRAQAQVSTPLGTVLMAATERGLGGLWFEDQAHHPGPLDAPWAPEQPHLIEASQWLAHYFGTAPTGSEAPCVPLDPRGTPFQREVWQALLSIPAGACRRYGELAHSLGRPQAARAVGAAIARNPISLLIPCHRVVGHDGALTGYAGGLARKSALLQRESARP